MSEPSPAVQVKRHQNRITDLALDYCARFVDAVNGFDATTQIEICQELCSGRHTPTEIAAVAQQIGMLQAEDFARKFQFRMAQLVYEEGRKKEAKSEAVSR